MKKLLMALALGLLAVSMADAGFRGRRRWSGRRGCATTKCDTSARKCDPCPDECEPGPKPCCYKTVQIEPELKVVPRCPIKYWECNGDCEGNCC